MCKKETKEVKTNYFKLVALLIRELNDDCEFTRRLAAEALGLIGDERAVEPLTKVWKTDKSVNVRVWAAYGLMQINGNKEAFEYILDALKDEDASARSAAVCVLGEMGNKLAVELLIKTLEDRSEWIRWSAAITLGEIGDKRAVEPLINTLNDEDMWVRYYVATALGKLRDKRAIEPLKKLLRNEREKCVREAVTEALAKIASLKDFNRREEN